MKKIITTTLAGLLVLSTMQHTVVAMDIDYQDPTLYEILSSVPGEAVKGLKSMAYNSADYVVDVATRRTANANAKKAKHLAAGKALVAKLNAEKDGGPKAPKKDAAKQGSSRGTKLAVVAFSVLLGADYVGRERLATSWVPMTKYLVQENDGPGLDTPYEIAGKLYAYGSKVVNDGTETCSKWSLHSSRGSSVQADTQLDFAANNTLVQPFAAGNAVSYVVEQTSGNAYNVVDVVDPVIIADAGSFVDGATIIEAGGKPVIEEVKTLVHADVVSNDVVKQTDASKLEKTPEQQAAEILAAAIAKSPTMPMVAFDGVIFKNVGDVQQALLQNKLPYTAQPGLVNYADLVPAMKSWF